MEDQTQLQNPSKSSPWGNYFKEFLMLFLAISLGFFVENLRENMAEKNQELEFMREIVENLKYDTIRYTRNFKINQYILQGHDTLAEEIKLAIDGKTNPDRLFTFAFLIGEDFKVAVPNTNAMMEMKHSGIIRLIRNKELAYKLGDYYERKLKVLELYRPSEFIIGEMKRQRIRHFSSTSLQPILKMYRDYGDSTLGRVLPPFDEMVKQKPGKLLVTDKSSLEAYLSTVTEFQLSLMSYQEVLFQNRETATQLISDIKKEYHFD